MQLSDMPREKKNILQILPNFCFFFFFLQKNCNMEITLCAKQYQTCVRLMMLMSVKYCICEPLNLHLLNL